MAENCSICNKTIPDPSENYGTDNPVCIDCWSELVDLRDVLERELEYEEVERRR